MCVGAHLALINSPRGIKAICSSRVGATGTIFMPWFVVLK